MPALLQLVGEQRLPVDELALADITEQYSAYLKTVDEVDLGSAGDFLAAAARLMLLKSEVLLPRSTQQDEADDEAPALEQALADREGLRAAGRFLTERQGTESFPSTGQPELLERPVEPRPVSSLRRAWEEMGKRKVAEVIRVATPSFVRLEVALSRLIRDLKSGTRLSLHRLLRGSNRNDVVIHFIAVLELIRRRQAAAAQPELFGEITLERVESDLGARFRAG